MLGSDANGVLKTRHIHRRTQPFIVKDYFEKLERMII